MPAPRNAKAAKGGYPVQRKRRPQVTRDTREIDHKNIALIKRYTNEFGAIESRRRSGNAPVTQRMLAQAIKRARILALLPFVKN
ncbi:MAG TPA: 30S ribosomal protein S18 [Verrucomicrobiae bacterium]|nr:30S ribosomal protein S18 [Verrucomicrobiae bacterium]